MRSVLLLAACAALILPGSALARECGIPDSKPLWVDFAGHDAPLPQKPGLTLAFASGTVKPSEARAAGASTVFFDLNFNNRGGTPTVPTDPATIADRADRLFDFAVTVTGCATPWIAMNELFGAQTPTPWTETTAQYRANTLALVRRLAERGAKPLVTIANPPYTGGEAAQWWRDLAAVAVLIRQVFFTAPNVPQLHALGPVRASRSMRGGMRALVRRFTEIGIPASRVALELQFQSAPGTGGREGLQPRSKWLEIVKLQALAVRQVTRELGTHSIWSWGWATFSQAGIDRDKGEAVCVYLWVRDPRLCSGPGAAGPAMDPSLTVGQLDQLAPGVVCQLPAGQIRTSAVAPLARAIGDRDIAASVVLERLVLQQEVNLDLSSVLVAELAFVDDHFRGSVPSYLAALTRVRLTRAAARGLLLDELRRDVVRARFRPPPPSAAAVAEFHRTYAGLQARLVETPSPVEWLGGRSRGLAVETFAPARIFALARGGRVRTLQGRIEVNPLGDTVYLGTVPLVEARHAIETSLNRFARVSVYENWLASAEARALAEAVCVGDELPAPAGLTLNDLLPVTGAGFG
ncbi:MAG: hypothetical protein H0T10_06240 [Actinobacteria bacterium]|nr:hypothetical protein [Actinomycetota bacterium]